MQSTSSSTRTFITPPAKDKKAAKEPKQHKPFFTRRNVPWIIVVVLILVSAFLLWQYHSAQQKLDSTSNKQVNEVISQVRKIVVVPANETPTVATVVHADKLRSQVFFANAQDGDKVLVFANERKAVLYRPSTGQIVNIAPVNVNAGSGSTNVSQ